MWVLLPEPCIPCTSTRRLSSNPAKIACSTSGTRWYAGSKVGMCAFSASKSSPAYSDRSSCVVILAFKVAISSLRNPRFMRNQGLAPRYCVYSRGLFFPLQGDCSLAQGLGFAAIQCAHTIEGTKQSSPHPSGRNKVVTRCLTPRNIFNSAPGICRSRYAANVALSRGELGAEQTMKRAQRVSTWTAQHPAKPGTRPEDSG